MHEWMVKALENDRIMEWDGMGLELEWEFGHFGCIALHGALGMWNEGTLVRSVADAWLGSLRGAGERI